VGTARLGARLLVLSESADFLYKTTDYYAPAHERCIAWNDPALASTGRQTTCNSCGFGGAISSGFCCGI
jgi:hypothetical protein